MSMDPRTRALLEAPIASTLLRLAAPNMLVLVAQAAAGLVCSTGSRVTKEIADMNEKYLEDFAVGQIYGSGRITVEKERIKAFAAEFDPQPFHLDEDAARRTIFGGLAASGGIPPRHDARACRERSYKPAGGIVGAGFDEFRWPLPVRPGDEWSVESEVLEVRPSKSRPNQGVIKVRTTTRNQKSEAVQVSVINKDRAPKARLAFMIPGAVKTATAPASRLSFVGDASLLDGI